MRIPQRCHKILQIVEQAQARHVRKDSPVVWRIDRQDGTNASADSQ